MKRNSGYTLRAVVAGLLVATCALGAFSKVGTTGANFLKIGVGRATGMGDAFCAIADDAAAAYYNPAGLAGVERCVQLNHLEWIADLTHEHLSAVLPTNFGTVALSVTALAMGDIEQTAIDNPSTRLREDEGTGLFFGASDFAVGVSYARIITDKLSFGITAKAINQSIWAMSASAVGADLGLHYNTGWKSLRVGAAITNFGTQLSFTGRQLDYSFFWDDSGPSQLQGSYKTSPAPLPTTFRFGAAMNVVDQGDNVLTAALDVLHPSDINETVNFGLEYGYAKRFFVRAGYVLNTDVSYQEKLGWGTGLSAGLGVRTAPAKGLKLGLDYGYRFVKYLDPSHRLLLTVGF
jgi:hypothetical protein